ncbi:heparin lyase I family protein [Streptomyces lichenis]|uniref:Polysaccharide lyase n=1 Tax=Streptomyces lichenis TaxID=2306967 RepID=A0ABT0I9L1_9ACTN|nr:heparin lyase I family protein [Streptomyces lichenis]MCK8678021.1 polysaccharide lyase [Streptomyces lichenis]
MPTHGRTTRRRTPLLIGASAAAAGVVALVNPLSAQAAMVWDGDAAKGTGVFGNVECSSPGSLVTAAQTDGHGTVFRYSKSVGTYRCESRGIKVGGSRYAFANNQTYWLGWEQKFSVVPSSTDWVPWQWKSYPNAQQNYPLLMTVGKGKVNLVYAGPGQDWKYIWSKPVTAFDWNRVAIGIHTSSSASSGWVELYYNGAKQTFSNGSTRFSGRTWDSANEPKWGAYDRGNTTSEIVNRVDSLKVGTAYGDVD